VFQIRFRTMQRGLRELMVTGDVNKVELEALRRALDVLPGSYEKALEIARAAGVLSVVDESHLADVYAADTTPGHEQAKAELQKALEKHPFSVWDRFESNPRFQALWKQTGALTAIFGQRGPSYLPPRVFALTLLDTLAPPDQGEHGNDVIAQAQVAAATVQNPLLCKWMEDALAEGARDRDELLKALESSFDSVMNRVSGWYKRWSTIWVVVFAILVAVGMNADSYAIGQRLWQDPAVRSAVVAQATRASTTVCAQTTSGQGTKASLDQTAKCVTQVEALGLPFGWASENRPDFTTAGVLSKAFGLVITVFALMLGAPFWFDTLSKLARLKTTGKPEGTAAK
jgi:hypothetical protein